MQVQERERKRETRHGGPSNKRDVAFTCVPDPRERGPTATTSQTDGNKLPLYLMVCSVWVFAGGNEEATASKRETGHGIDRHQMVKPWWRETYEKQADGRQDTT